MKKEKGLKGLKIKGSVLLMLAASGALVPQLAFATSAGTILRNEVEVTYADNAANTYQETDSVDVTVDLVGGVAWGAEPTGQTVGQGEELAPDYTITLTNTGNGSDTYTLTDNTSESCSAVGESLSAQSFVLSSVPDPLTLGATVSSAAATYNTVPNPDQTTIPVSNLVAGDFSNGDTVIINNLPYLVVSATENVDPLLPDTLVIEDPTGVAAAFVTGAGFQIGEQAVVTYGGAGVAGTLGDPADVCQHDHSLLATGSTPNDNPAATDVVSGWVTVVEAVDVTVTKYVRNNDDADKNPAPEGNGDIEYEGISYWATGVTGNPGHELQYLVVIVNTSNADAVNVVFSDALPAFTTYVTTSLQVDTDGDETFDVTTDGTGPLPDESEADNEGGIATQFGQQIDVYPGLGGDEDTDAGGTVPDNSKTAVRYSVTIDG